MQKVFDALVVHAYQSSNLQLACPSDPDTDLSVEDRTGDSCDILRGTVPWQTLGLSESDVISKGGGYFTYIIDQASIDLCNSTIGRAGTLDDLNSSTTDNFLFALVDHGTNRAGAVTGVGTYASVPSTTEEQANCTVGTGGNPCGSGSASITAGAFRSGPSSNESSSFFDDIVLIADIGNDTSVDNNCFELAEQDGDLSDGGQDGAAGQTATGAALGFDDQQFSRNITVSSDDQTGEKTRSFQTPDDALPAGGALDGIRVRDSNTDDTRSCLWTELAFPLDSKISGEGDSHAVRVFLQFGSEVETTNPRGDGAVIAFADTYIVEDNAANQKGGGLYQMDATRCGGPGGEYLGFEEDTSLPGIIQWPTGAYYFGVEIDTENHQVDIDIDDTDDTTVGDGVVRQDNEDNHIAIVQRNTDHQNLTLDGPDLIDGPRCDINSSGDGTVRIDGFTSGIMDGSLNGADTSSLHGCYANTDGANDTGTSNNWLEQDDDDVANFHSMRIEVDNNSLATTAGCDAQEVLVQFWIWPTDGAIGLNCPYTSICSDLSDTYLNLQSAESVATTDNPHGAMCVEWPSDENMVHVGILAGRDATPNGTNSSGISDQFTVRTFSVGYDRDFSSTPSEISDQTTEEWEINAPRVALHLVNAAYLDAADTTTEYVVNGLNFIEDIEAGSDTLDPELSARFGKLAIRFDNSIDGNPEVFSDHEGIGVDGIDNGDGTENESLANFFDTDTDTLSFNPINLREAVEARMPQTAYRKASIGLGSFEFTENGDAEQAILDFYLGDNRVERHLVNSCNTASGNDIHKVITVQTSSAFNTVRITPNPAGAGTARQDGSGFSVRGIKFCGIDNSCGLLTNNECYEHINVTNAWPVRSGAGSGVTALYTRTYLQQLAQGQQYTNCASPDSTSVAVQTGSNADPILAAQSSRATGIGITVGGEDYAWLRVNNPNQCNSAGEDPYVDIVASGTDERVRVIENTNVSQHSRDGFGYDSANGDDGRLDGGGSTPTETMQIRFPHTWERFAFNLGRFSTNERVRVTAYLNESQVSTQDYESCTSGGNDATGQIIWSPGTFDRIDVSAIDGATSGESDFVVRGFRACDGVDAGCTSFDTGIYPFSQDDGTDNCSLSPV